MTKHTLTKKLLSVTLSALTAFSSGAAAMTTAFYSAPAVYAAGESLSPQDSKLLKAEEKMMIGVAKEVFKSIPFFSIFTDSLDSILDLTGAFGGGGSGGSGVSREDLDKLREHLDEELNHIKADIARLGVDLKNEINMTFYAGNLGQELVDMHTTSSLNADNIARYKNSADYPTENDRLVMVASLIGNTNDWSNNKQNLVYRIHQIGLLLKGTTYSDLDGKSIYQKVYDYYAKKSLFSGEIYEKAVPYINSVVYEYLYAYSVLMECMEASLKVARFTAEDEKALSDKVSEEYKKIKSNSASVIAEEVGAETLLLFNFKNEKSLVSQYSNFLYNAENNRFTYLNKGTTLKAVKSTLGSYEPGSESEVGEIRIVKTNGSTDTNAHSTYNNEKSRLENALSRYSVIPCSNIGQMGNYVSENYANSGSVWNFLKNIGFTYTAPDNRTNMLVTNSKVRDDNPSAADGSGYNTYEHRYYLGYNGYVYNNQRFSPEDITVYALVDKKERDEWAYQAIAYNHFYRTYIASPANSKPVNLFYFEGADEFKNTSTFDYDMETNMLTVTAKSTGAAGRQDIRVQYRENADDNWTTSYAPTTVITLKYGCTYEVRTIISDESGNKETTDTQYITTPALPVLVESKEPYIDDNGDYKLGIVKHYEYNGKNYAVNKDGSRGEKLSDITLSYFEFELLSNNTYQISYYTGEKIPNNELVIPKTYNGRKITVLSQNESTTFFKDYKTGLRGSNFTLVLNENITTINKYAFYNTKLNKVMGDTSNLNKIDAAAFGSLGSLEIHLDYPGQINNTKGAMLSTNAVIYLKHSTTFKNDNMCKSVSYRFSDAHSFENPVWYWSYDYEVVTMTVTCTNEKCQETQMFYANITSKTENGTTYYTATVDYNGKIYKDSREVAHTHTYSAPVWQWSDDHSTAKAVFTCKGGDDTQTVNAAVKQTEETDKIVYTATAQFEGKTYTDTYTEEKPHIHTYGEPVWNWSEDYSKATAAFSCTDGDDTQIVDAAVTAAEEDEKKIYTAVVEWGGKTYTNTVTALHNTSKLSDERIGVNDTATVYCQSEGGYGNTVYTVSYSRNGHSAFSAWYTLQTDSENTEIPFRPKDLGFLEHNGIYTFKIEAVNMLDDGRRCTDTKTLDLYVGDPFQNTSDISDRIREIGSTVYISCSSQGGVCGHNDVRYSVYYRQASSDEWITLANREKISSPESFVPKTEGLYEVRVEAVDVSTNETAGRDITVYACETLVNTSAVVADTVNDPIIVNCSAEGGTGSNYLYTVYYRKYAYNDWTYVQTESENTVVLITPTQATKYEVMVAVVNTVPGIDDTLKTLKKYTVTVRKGHTYGEPVWNWSDDHTSAEAVFTCTDGDDTQTVKAVVTKTENTDKIVYTAAADFNGKTYTDTHTEETYVYYPAAEPYIDENGAYILGYIEHYEYMGKYYAVGNDKSVGEEISDIWISYFAFELLDNDTYAIKYYTGKTKNLTEIVIPKTFNGRKITVLGTDELDVFIKSGKPQFTLVLNENISEIKSSAFNTIGVNKVTGNTSGLNKIGDYAFSWANRTGNYELDITLDYPGEITVGKTIFNHVNATVHIGDTTTFSSTKFGASKIVIIESFGSENNPYQIYSVDDLEKYLTDSQYTGKYIKLYDDITLNETDDLMYHFGKDTVMVLNDHTLTLNNAALFIDNCSLTVMDSITAGMITSNYKRTVIVSETGTLNILMGGIIENTNTEADSAVIENRGTTIMESGYINGKHSFVSGGEFSRIRITGGTINGTFLGSIEGFELTGGGAFSFDPIDYIDKTKYETVKVFNGYTIVNIGHTSGFAPETIGGNDEENNKDTNSAVSAPNSTPKTGDTTSAVAILAFLLSSLGAVITLAKKRKRKEQA